MQAESFHEREANRAAGGSAAEESARLAALAAEQADRLRQERLAEKEAQRKKRSLSWKDKVRAEGGGACAGPATPTLTRLCAWRSQEKRKRDRGMQSSGKDYVQESKRVAREAGVYSGFDT